MKKLEKCVACGSGRLVRKRVTRSYGRDLKDIVVVRNVPVVVCRDCGESYTPASALKRIQGIIQGRDALDKREVPVAKL